MRVLKQGSFGAAGSWLVEGIAEDFIPEIAHLSRVKFAYSIPDGESFAAARELLHAEGILAGSSSGTLLAAVLRYCRIRARPERVVSFVCDTGAKYLSSMFNNYWMRDQGFLARPAHGDLSDLMTRHFAEGSVVTVKPVDTLLAALGRMKRYEVSQLPVMNDGHVVGIVDEEDLLHAVVHDMQKFSMTVATVMSTKLTTVDVRESTDRVTEIRDSGHVPLVMDGERFVGLITRVDLLNSLRRKLKH